MEIKDLIQIVGVKTTADGREPKTVPLVTVQVVRFGAELDLVKLVFYSRKHYKIIC